MAIEWNERQKEAINKRGKNILVSASAGSGKTAVLTERIVRICLDEKIDIDKFVIVTFTRLAASEMKSRIAESLEKAKEDDNYDIEYINNQIVLLEKANIQTLDSFNISLLRDYFYLIDVEPNFKIIDEVDSQILKNDVMKNIFDKYYKEKDKTFITLLDMYSAQNKDDGLKDIIDNLYNDISNMPNPDKALDDLLINYNTGDIENGLYYITYKNEVIKKLNDYIKLLDKYNLGDEFIINEENNLRGIIDALNTSFDDARSKIMNIVFDRLPRKLNIENEEKELFKALREEYKDFINEDLKNIFKYDKETLVDNLNEMKVMLEKIITITKEYKEELFNEKKKNNNYDFNDIAHLVIKLLVDEKGNYTELSKNLKLNYEYIIVDEYQDINEIQETILKAISRENKDSNMFMVGDVKQSIYRFRKADPQIFTDKYNMFKEEKDPYSIKIDLNQNFRSRKEVLESINYIFKKVMIKDVGGIVYDEDMALKYGNGYEEEKYSGKYITELILIPNEKDLNAKDKDEDKDKDKDKDENKNDNDSQSEEENNEEKITNDEAQAQIIVKKIKELFDNNTEVYNAKLKKYVPLKYSDIAILYRTFNKFPYVLFEELKKNNIPAVISKQDDFLDELDVQIAISMLKVIDNPYDNIAFVTTMYSEYYKFTPEELMTLKQRNKYKTSYFDICKYEYYLLNNKVKDDTKENYNVDDEKEIDKENENKNENKKELSTITKDKIKKVIETYEFLKDYNLKNSLCDLVKKIYDIFNQEKYFMRFLDMKNKVDNMNLLLKFAKKFEESGSKNIYDFITVLNKIKDSKKSLDMKNIIEASNAVNIMTVHKSKGLEYPVVFVPNLEKGFNKMDNSSKILNDKNLGLVTKYINVKDLYQRKNLFYQTIQNKNELENIAEELRIFYVALTRAKEKLYLIASYTDNEKNEIKYLNKITNGEYNYSYVSNINSYLDIIMPAIKENNSCDYIEVNTYVPDKETTKEEISDSPMKLLFDEIKDELIDESKIDKYKYEEETKIKRKVSVTEVKKKYHEQLQLEIEIEKIKDDEENNAKNNEEIKLDNKKIFNDYKPTSDILKKIIRKDKDKLTGAEKGTIMHKLAKIMHDKDIDKEFERLINENYFTKNELDQINKEKIKMYLESDTYQRIEKSNFVKREMPFMMKEKASEIYKEVNSDDYVIIQGIIDCLFEEDGKIVILDYKTDKVNKEGITKEERIEELKKEYKVQLDLYEKAVKMIYKKEIKEKILYLFDSGDTVRLD